MKNILDRITNLSSDCFYYVIRKGLQYDVRFGDSGCMFHCYSRDKKLAIQMMIDRVFRKRNKRESEIKNFLERLGLDKDITKEQIEIKLSLMGL